MAYPDFRHALMASSAVAVVALANPAWSQTRTFDIAAQPAASGISAFARQADVQVLISSNDAQGRRTAAVQGPMTVDAGLRQLLAGSGLSITSGDGRTYTLGLASAARTAQLEDSTAVDDIIVTAQKREQSIQDVPIAVSAFSADTLDAMKIESGSELLRAIPNVSFSKANFSMYNFSIRGIGTKAVSASSDPAVAISFNNAPMIRNRLFESEYLDVSRVEVLRGPQGTLYGRNATAGVVNMIPNLPGPDFDALLKAEVGNYGTFRNQIMLNVPVSDMLAVRFASSTTKREGFDYNSFKDTQVNGRDLFSTRLSALFTPTDRFSASLIWEHFGEDDNRSRTGKQLCSKDLGPTRVGNTDIDFVTVQNRMSQGCLAEGLYADSAYGSPNGAAFAHIFLAGQLTMGSRPATTPSGRPTNFFAVDFRVDPYLNITQSRDLREIATSYDPAFRATNDIIQLNMDYDLTPSFSLHSQTTFTKDDYFSTQDYNRFVSNPLFADTDGAVYFTGIAIPTSKAAPGGYYHDPQLGLSNRLLSADLSQSDNKQFTQEFRLTSNLDGNFNFHIGANYLNFETEDNYYVFSNLFSYLSEYYYNSNALRIRQDGYATYPCDANFMATRECMHVDRSSISDLEGDGHNYFRSRNIVDIQSFGIYGETYLEVTPEIRITTGLRYTDDRKRTVPISSQLLLGALPNGQPGPSSGGFVSRGYPEGDPVKQDWQALTGRFVVDWSPDLAFTDDTLFYASYSRGYKGGGMNPPRIDLNPKVLQYSPLPESFEPEYVDAFEIGTKNSFADGRVRLNANAFYYNYSNYQVSQIVDRISLNENFDAEIWGAELEFIAQITPNWRIDGNAGYLKTKLADGEKSVDVMNRTQGNPEWALLRPWLQVPSNCIAPVKHIETILARVPNEQAALYIQALCGGSSRTGSFTPNYPTGMPLWSMFGFEYDPLVDAPNFGRGFDADLSGNELPNSPRWTMNLGTQYQHQWGAWESVFRVDYYWQDDSYFRVYNTHHDVIRAWDNLNISATLRNDQNGLTLQAYVKNVLDDAPIVDAFINSDDTGLTTNVFTLDPRVWGVSLTKRF
ncbi:TonB-dependent receptor [Brevundimonas sp.]|uniref:TonB-dependent receptor n=4 Tax=Brevundimonas sp. TaxID=1871086 RepID=UPI002FC899D1